LAEDIHHYDYDPDAETFDIEAAARRIEAAVTALWTKAQEQIREARRLGREDALAVIEKFHWITDKDKGYLVQRIRAFPLDSLPSGDTADVEGLPT
jgi:hypothetical protein